MTVSCKAPQRNELGWDRKLRFEVREEEAGGGGQRQPEGARCRNQTAYQRVDAQTLSYRIYKSHFFTIITLIGRVKMTYHANLLNKSIVFSSFIVPLFAGSLVSQERQMGGKRRKDGREEANEEVRKHRGKERRKVLQTEEAEDMKQ